MQVCHDKHEEVCYDGRYCPMCDLKYDLREVEKERDDLIKKLSYAEERIEELESGKEE